MEFIQKSIKNESQPQSDQKESRAENEESKSNQDTQKHIKHSNKEETQDLSTQRLGSQNKQLKIETRNEVNYSPLKK